jgi:hypothetical protein
VSVMAKLLLLLLLLLLPVALAACSGDSSDDADDAAGSGGSTSQPAGSGAVEGNAGTGRAGSSSGMGASGASGASSAAGSGGNGNAGSEGAGKAGAGGGSSSEYAEVGVCGLRGMGTVSESEFSGYQELYIISEEGFGEDICVVRFDVKRVGAAPDGCDDPAGDVDCLWTHMVELSNPMMMTDEGGVCADSELGLDAAAIAKLVGSRFSYGFVSEFAGHNSVLMKYDDASGKWDADGNANWNAETGAFRFDRRDGFCNYGKKP